MSSWYYYSNRTSNRGDQTVTPEGRARQEKKWFEAGLCDGKNLRRHLPLRGELNWIDLEFPPTPAILPKHAISRTGLINEIWVLGHDCKIRIGDHSFIRVYQDVQISYSGTSFRVYRGAETDILLLSHKKLKVVPYLWKD